MQRLALAALPRPREALREAVLKGVSSARHCALRQPSKQPVVAALLAVAAAVAIVTVAAVAASLGLLRSCAPKAVAAAAAAESAP